MKKLKKVLSILLIVSMVFSSSGTYVLAESVGESIAKTDHSTSHQDYGENTESIEISATTLLDKKDVSESSSDENIIDSEEKTESEEESETTKTSSNDLDATSTLKEDSKSSSAKDETDETESESDDNTTTASIEEAETTTTVITSDITESTKKEIVDEENIATNSDVDGDSAIVDEEKEEIKESVATNSEVDNLLFGERVDEATASETSTPNIPSIPMFKKHLGNIDDDYVAPKAEESSLFGTDPLPARWDSREHTNTTTGLSYVSPIRNQSPYGICWAFATAGMFETSIRKKGLATTDAESNLSELALAYFMYNLKGVTSNSNYAGTPGLEGDDYTAINKQYFINRGKPQDATWAECGGNQSLSTKVVTSFVGMVVEDSVTEFSNNGSRNQAMLNAEAYGIPYEYAFNKNGYIPKDIKYINKVDKDEIKKAIMENGSVGFSYYAEEYDDYAFHWDDNGSYYHAQNQTGTNHAVMIIGWDDNIDAKKFYYGGQGAQGSWDWSRMEPVYTNPPTEEEYNAVADGNKSSSNGAWLVRNSWGTSHYFLKDGYFYIPYDEPSISGTFYTVDAIPANTYKYNYHYDTTGTSYSASREAFGNVFKVTGDDNQLIEAVNVGIDDVNKEYDIKIYVKDTEMSDPTDGTLVATKRCSNQLAGFYTFELDTKVSVAKDTYFSVVLDLDEGDSAYMFLDYTSHPTNSWNHTYNEIKQKQSFTGYKYGTNVYWQDLAGSSTETIDGKTYGRAVRLKAYGNSGLAVSFNANGGEGTMSSQAMDANVTTNLNKNKFKKTGFRFSHWVDEAGNEYDDEGEITITTSVTLTAMWEEAKYNFNQQWFDRTKLGMDAKDITSIKIMMYPDALPSDLDASYEAVDSAAGIMPRGKGLTIARKGTEIFIYAPDKTADGKIEVAGYAYGLFSGGGNDLTDWDNGIFAKCGTIEGLSLLDTSNVRTMKRWFAGFGRDLMWDSTFTLLPSPGHVGIDVSSFDTGNVTAMSYMFEQAAIRNINISNLNTQSLENTDYMFAQSAYLQSINLTGFGTATISSAQGMFTCCDSLESINFGGATFENTLDMSYMFDQCPLLENLDLRSFDTRNVTSITGMFNNCTNLRRIIINEDTFKLDNVNISDAQLINVGVFGGDTALTGQNGTTIATLVASGVSNNDAIGITYARVDKAGTPGYFTEAPTKEYILPQNWFNETNANIAKGSVTKIIISKFPEAAPTSVNATWNIGDSNGLVGYTKGTEITIYAPEKGTIFMPQNSSYLFSGSGTGHYNSLREITNLDKLDTSRVTDMKGMFESCQLLETINLSNFSTSNVTDMSNMFYYCKTLGNINLSSFNTANVERFNNMFFYCSHMTQINVSNFDTSKAEDISGMFKSCTALTSIDVSNFDTSNVEDMSSLFSGCSALTTIDLSNFDTRKVTNMSQMFNFPMSNTSQIASIDLSSFDTSNVTSMAQMFYNCSNLQTILVSNAFVTTKLSGNMSDLLMFDGCSSLVGGNDTAYSSSYKNKLYARIDGKSNLPGYFTGKNMVAVTFDYDGKGTNYVEVFNKGSAITEPTSPTTTGFTFVHWYKEGTSDTVAYNFADLLPQDNTKKMKLIAKWAPTVYTINYDAGTGATVSPTSFTKTYGDPITTDLAVPTKPGYTFDNWYTDTTYTTAYNKTNDNIYVLGTSTYTIHAKFNPNEYQVDYDLGGVGATKPATITKTFDSPLAAGTLVNPTNIPTGYTFAGWYKESTYASEWTGNDDLTNGTTTQTIYARWKARITFNANGHGTTPAAVDVYLNADTTLPSISDVEGFSFDTTNSWYDDSDVTTATRIGAVGDNYTVLGPKTLYAKWNENEYQITYYNVDSSDGVSWRTDYTAPSNRKYSEETVLPLSTDLTKNDGTNDYIFKGWYTVDGSATDTWDETKKVTKINANTVAPVGGHKLYARWNGAWKISFNMLNHGIAISDIVAEQGTKVSTEHIPTNPTETGYIFSGWYKNYDASATAFDDKYTNPFNFSTDVVTANMTLFAKWKPITYTISYNANGGTVSRNSDTKVYDENLTLVVPTRTGYDFDAWYQDYDAATKTFTNPYDGSTNISDTNGDTKTVYAKWIAHSYTVDYNLGTEATGAGAVAPTSTINKTYGESIATGALQNPSVIPSGYEFLGWYKEATFEHEWTGAANDDLTNENGVTVYIYAKWKRAVVFSVLYNGNDIHATVPASIEITGPTDINLPTIEASGYVFGGWYRSDTDFSDANRVPNPVNVSVPTTFYAKWTPISYKIYYKNVDGSSMADGTYEDKTYDSTITLDTSITKTGYDFGGWFTDNTTFANPYDGTTDLSTEQNVDKEIYAKWNPHKYNISYELSGHATSMTATEKIYGVPYTVPSPTGIVAGYKFDGWFKESTHTTPYTGDDLTTGTDPQTIYARWKATITYDANGHGTAPSPVDVILGQNTTLPSISNVTGFSFDTTNSWYDGSDISTATLVGAASAGYTVYEPKRLYARWNENEYSITYDRDGGSWASGYDPATAGTDKRKYSEEKILPVALNISKTGYTFIGWYKQGDTTETIISKINANVDEAVSVKAKWSENTYNITLNKNGGDYVAGYNVPSTRLYTEGKTLPTNDDIKKVGHRLEGWHEQENFSDTAILTVDANTASHKTFYAKWVPETYGVTLNTNGGTINAGDVSSYTYGTAETLPTDVTKAGSVFKGWWTGDGTDDNWGTQVSAISVTDTGIKTYYARWSESYVVTFNLTTGTAPAESNITNKPDAQNVESGGTAVRPIVNPQANNFEFVGWYDSTLTTEYNFSTPITGATTIYAKWNNVSTHEVTFNLISGTVHPTALTDITGVPETQYIVNNRVVTKPTDPTATGYKFVGWYTDDTFGTVWSFDNDVVTEPKTIYGKWELQKYTITYIRNDGEWTTGFDPTVERLYGTAVTLPISDNISKYGYTFVGWFENSDFTNQISEIAGNFADNKTVYASWTRLDTTKIITFNDSYSGATAEQAFVVGDNNEIRTNVFTRPGYTFIRWKDIAGNVYLNTSQLTDDITLYAEWQQNPAPAPTPYVPSRGDSDSSSSGSSGSSGRSTGGPIPQNQIQQQQQIGTTEIAKQREVSTSKSSQIIVNGLTSQWQYDPINNSWKLSALDLMGVPIVAVNGFYILNQVTVVMENNSLVPKTVQDTYYFDQQGNMVTGWVKTNDSKWYFFNNEKTLDEGKLCIGWKKIDGFWYFFSSSDGSMLANTTTSDGYKVGSDGKWIQ